MGLQQVCDQFGGGGLGLSFPTTITMLVTRSHLRVFEGSRHQRRRSEAKAEHEVPRLMHNNTP